MNEQKKTLLVVDDTPANIQIVNSILKDIYKIRVATDGTKALALVRASPRRLKADRTTSDIPVIFLTGPTEIEDETRGFDVGAVDYIHKPFSPAVVKARVQTHLVLRGVREQLAQQLATIQKELETARQIQLSILPKEVPRLSDLDIAARYIPMTAVAGDFYDFIRAGERQLGVLVADVSGHGMPAALIASMLKIALAGQVVNAADPAKVLLV